MTLVDGLVTRSMSASDAAASRSTPGPSTIAYSSGVVARLCLSPSRFSTTRLALPVTEVNSSALDGLLSTMMGIGDHRNRFAEVVPGPAWTLDLSLR